jgi:glutathione peroxidase-family protein
MMVLKSLTKLLVTAAGLFTALPAFAATCPSLLDHSFPRLQDSSSQSLCQCQGKVILVLNTASLCGFTGQYEGLEAVYDKYLVDRSGNTVESFNTLTAPDSRSLIAQIERRLAEKP